MVFKGQEEGRGLVSLRRFLETHPLPRVVRLVSHQPGDTDLLGQDLLFYKHYNAGKIEAVSGSHTSLVVPDTFQGWLSIVTERGHIKARCYTTVQKLVAAQVTSFLTTSEIPAYTLNNRPNIDGTRQQYVRTNVAGGQVLKLLAVYQDVNSHSTRSKRLSWPLLYKSEHNRYAQCLTHSDQVLYIPVTTAGQFYAVATASNAPDESITRVYQLPKLLRTFPLPVRVCIINSLKPQGSMLLETYRKEEVILACLLPQTPSEGYKLLEIDVNSKFFVQLSPTDKQSSSDCAQAALRYCHTNAARWSRQLKIIHHIYPAPGKRRVEDSRTVRSGSFRYTSPSEHVYSNLASLRKNKGKYTTKILIGEEGSELSRVWGESGYPQRQEVVKEEHRTRLTVVGSTSDCPYSDVQDRIQDNVYAEINEYRQTYSYRYNTNTS